MTRSAIVALSLASCLTLSGCGSLIKVHRLDVQQGNVINSDKLQRLHKGMSEERVKDILGDPVLSTFVQSNTLEYVYTWQPGYGKFTEKRLTVYFRQGGLDTYQVETQ